MKLINNPKRKDWPDLLARPALDALSLEKKVRKILNKVKREKDNAVKQFTRDFDGVKLKSLIVTEKEMADAIKQVPEELKKAIRTAKNNIAKFHSLQIRPVEYVDTMPGVRCWRNGVAIEKVGLYIPGGTAPLFSTVLMLGIPAKLAGCKEIVLCSPPSKETGRLHPAILFAAKEVGITTIIKAGGVQAIAAMAYGTETIPQVYKIFGPGNQYVNCAKQLVQSEGIAIDMPAGPSEVCVLADETANPAFVAADLLSQAEHGIDSQVLLVSTDKEVLKQVDVEIEKQAASLPRKKLALQALSNSKLIFLKSLVEAIDMVNSYAPEHLIIAAANEETIAKRICNAGSVFLGNYSPESAGDYASGTNHALPTNGYARSYAGVSVDSFVKKITWQKLTARGLQNIGQTIITMAEAEGLQAHANAVKIRLDQINVES
jgi:histidinol dehydrogenase